MSKPNVHEFWFMNSRIWDADSIRDAHTINSPCTCSSSVRAAVCPCTRTIDHFSHECQQPAGALVNQNAASHLRQSGHLRVRHAAGHNWTRTPSRNIIQRAVFFLIHFSVQLICLWSSCHSVLGGHRDMAGGCLSNKPIHCRLSCVYDVIGMQNDR